MFQRLVLLLSLFSLVLVSGHAQGLETSATRDDWEEINFETNSSVLTDGYPSLLRLAELLSKNQGYKVRLEGHADSRGSNRTNEKLALARANTVKNFLTKYGANPAQISVASQGENAPKVPNKNKEGMFMNRRVSMTVTDGSGKTVSANSGVNEAIKSMEAITAAQQKCCDEILKRLDKLDEILAAVRNLQTENDRLKKDVDALKGQQSATQKQVAELPKPLQRPEVEEITKAQTAQAIEAARTPKISILGLNVGPTAPDGKITFTGKGRFFAPFKDSFALQAEGEYLYYRDRQEGQFDAGLVNRWNNFQAGLFSSFKHVNISQFDKGGNLGQAAVTIDYIFKYGRVGLFGTKGFLDNAIVNRNFISRNVTDETYLRIVDQLGVSATTGLWKTAYMEGNIGYLHSRLGNNKPGGTFRVVQPLNDKFAVTFEGGFNETMITRDSTGRVVVGFQFGNLLRPREFQASKYAVPTEIPRIRYEMLTRRVRTGNDPPVADAGADQIGVAAGQVTLDASASYDPDGDPITFQWVQTAGPAVSLSAPTAARTSFTAAQGQAYGFQVNVKDDKGGQSLARVRVTTQAPVNVRILRFQATPGSVRAGQPATLLWQTENAETVTLTPVGGSAQNVQTNGSTSTGPLSQTTQYRLTAKNRDSEANETITITVDRPQARILGFRATPSTVNKGESSTLSWETENASAVTISGIGNVNPTGTSVVSPAETTQYTITASNEFGSVSNAITVQVNTNPTGPQQPSLPRILSFTASPMDILNTEKSTLSWKVENADTVAINGLGAVPLQGTREVNPQTNTSYVITATNAAGSVTANVAINVTQGATISACMASPSTIKPGEVTTLSWVATNASSVSIAGVGVVPGSQIVLRPAATTTYVITATGQRSQVSCSVQVTVETPAGPPPPPAGNKPPTIVLRQTSFDSFYRDIVMDASQTTDPDGDPITFQWRQISGGRTAAILDPSSSVTRAQLGELYGPYVFEVTATDKYGQSSSARVTVNFISVTLR